MCCEDGDGNLFALEPLDVEDGALPTRGSGLSEGGEREFSSSKEVRYSRGRWTLTWFSRVMRAVPLGSGLEAGAVAELSRR